MMFARLALIAAPLAAGLLAASAPSGQAANPQNPSFNLLNKGSAPIKELYFTPAGDANWGRNRLDGETIPPGASYAARRRADGNCIFDIRIVFEGGRAEDRRNINTCEVDDIAFGEPGKSAGPTRRSKAPDDPSFRLVNRSGKPLVEAFATPAGQTNWGQNRLGGDPLPPHTDRVIHVDRQPSCIFDLRVVFADHKALERRRANLCKITDLPVP